MAIIHVDKLSFSYTSYHPETASSKVLSNISLEVDKGEVFAVMGPTGAGKTTLCLTLNGIIPHLTGGEMAGSVFVAGYDTRITHPSSLAGIVGMVYQDPENQLFCPSVEEEVAFGLENLGLPVGEINERVSWALQVAGMLDCRAMPPTRLSGGQKQRVAIACSLAMLPEILILDEPTSSLDPTGQVDVMTAIERLRRERQMTLVLVSNDADQVIQVADRLAIIIDGQVVSQGTPRELLCEQELMKMAGISPPQMVELSWEFNACCQSDYRWFMNEQAENDLRARLAVTR